MLSAAWFKIARRAPGFNFTPPATKEKSPFCVLHITHGFESQGTFFIGPYIGI